MAKAERWAKVLPKAILDLITFNGKVYLAPVNITSMNRLYYNMELLKKAGIEKPPVTAERRFFAALDKLKGIGVIPLALGGNATAIPLDLGRRHGAFGGKDHWLAVYVRRDPEAMKDGTQRKVFETFRRLGKLHRQGQ